jgi:hypothetical protein
MELGSLQEGNGRGGLLNIIFVELQLAEEFLAHDS